MSSRPDAAGLPHASGADTPRAAHDVGSDERWTTTLPLPNPYLLMSLLFGSLAALAALDSALTSLGVLSFFNGLRWLRVHLVTLGLLTEMVFGLLPLLIAARRGCPRPGLRWDIWLALNLGLLTLLVGIPLINAALILVGGALVFVATALVLLQLRALPPGPGISPIPDLGRRPAGRPFYLAGLAYLLIGTTIGTGLWLGWSAPLHIAQPVETHIHANAFGFLALTFAGLLVDLYPRIAGRPLAGPRSAVAIFRIMTLGALGLVLGPWLDSRALILLGALLHVGATGWLLLNIVRPPLSDRRAWTPGLLHLVTAYVWFLAPILFAPLIILNVPGAAAAGVEQTVPQALIYGWALQFGYALLPYVLARSLLPGEVARLGGTWLSLLGVHLGALLLWASLFVQPYQAQLNGVAYICWMLSLLPILAQSWRIVQAGLRGIEGS